MRTLELEGGDTIYDIARRAVDDVEENHEDVKFVFNTIETRVSPGMKPANVVKAHFDELTDRQNKIRAASPAYKIAREILSGQPEDVKNALRDLLTP